MTRRADGRHPLLPAQRLALGLALAWAPAAWSGEITVDVLDIGQGDAILIRGNGMMALIDAGDRGANTVQQLTALGVRHLDYVVATHPHADHIGRMADVLNTFEVGLYLDNGLPHTTATYAEVMGVIAAKKIPYEPASVGRVLEFGPDATFTVLFPDQQGPLTGTRSDLNSNSVVLRLDHGSDQMLFVGDAEEDTEDRLLSEHLLTDIDVLKVAHHGSNYASMPPFLSVVRPEYALISVGNPNKYGHPGEDTLARLAAVGAMVYRTDQSGDIRVISDGTDHLDVLEGSLTELDGVQVAAPKPTSPRPNAGGPKPGKPVATAPAAEDTVRASRIWVFRAPSGGPSRVKPKAG